MRYRFGEFELDGDAYTLRRDGRELPLQPKVFDLLRLLLKQGHSVTLDFRAMRLTVDR